MELRVFEGATPEQIRQFEEHAEWGNKAIEAGEISDTGRLAMTEEMKQEKAIATRRERARAKAAKTPLRVTRLIVQTCAGPASQRHLLGRS